LVFRGRFGDRVPGERLQGQNRIYLVLEYCAGGDLAAYIQRYGKVTEVVARHFMRQLGMWVFEDWVGASGIILRVVEFADNSWIILSWYAFRVEANKPWLILWGGCVFGVFLSGAGLQVLRNNNLIHRDLKPQVGMMLDFLQSGWFLGMCCGLFSCVMISVCYYIAEVRIL
jgi:hypothetical protein